MIKNISQSRPGKMNGMYGSSRTGKLNPFFGKKHSTETRKKISMAKKKQSLKTFLGKSHTEDAKEKMSLAKKGKSLSESHKMKLRESVPSGKYSPHWKGGLTTLQKRIRVSNAFKNWAINIKKRDNYTCRDCEIRGGYLHSHHIIPFSIMIKNYKIKTLTQAIKCLELWDIDNGITLCVPCHRKTETYGRFT